MIAHIVLFRPRADVTSEEKRAFADALQLACLNTPAMQRASIGRAVDVGAGYSANLGYTTYQYAAVMEFSDREGLLSYLSHPTHGSLSKLFWQICESTMILDVEMEDARGQLAL